MLEGAREESEAGSEPEGERPVGEIVAREDPARRRLLKMLPRHVWRRLSLFVVSSCITKSTGSSVEVGNEVRHSAEMNWMRGFSVTSENN